VSLNAFIAEVRRHFGKYTPHVQGRIMFKFSLALSLFSLALITTGIFVDQFHSEDPTRIQLKDGRTYFGPGIIVGHNAMKLTYPECEGLPEIRARQSSRMFDYKGVSFEQMTGGPSGTDEVFDTFVNPGENTVSAQYFGDFDTFYKMSIAAKVFSWSAFGFQLLSVIVMLWTQTCPASFLTKTPIFDQTDQQRSWGVIHHILTLLAAVSLLADLAVVSMYLDLLVGRVIELSFELCNFDLNLDELDTLKLFGTFLQSYSDVNGMTGSMFKVAMTLTMVQLTFVFYLGMSRVRAGVRNDTYSLPFSKLRELPWYCAIWDLKFSIFFAFVGTLVNQAAALTSREAGYPLNVYFFRTVASSETGTGTVQTGSLSDFVMDWTSKFYISERIPNSTMFAAIPLVFALAIGSTDPQRFLSKAIQLSGLVMFLKSFISISTLTPVSATVISRPYCYDPPPTSLWSFKTFFSRTAQCNHLMFSFDAAASTLGIMILFMYIRYGQAIKKFVAYTVLSITLIVCLMLPVAARVNYTSNVIIAVFLVVLLVVLQSQAFKLLFQIQAKEPGFTEETLKLKFTPGEVLNDKIIPNLNECLRRVELYRMATKHATGLRMSSVEIHELKDIYRTVGDAIRVARSAKPMEPTTPVGYRRRTNTQSNEVHTPPNVNEDVSDVINLMISGQSTRVRADVTAVNGDGNVIQSTPVPLAISMSSDDPQSKDVSH
jgi:hypothetical protein